MFIDNFENEEPCKKDCQSSRDKYTQLRDMIVDMRDTLQGYALETKDEVYWNDLQARLQVLDELIDRTVLL